MKFTYLFLLGLAALPLSSSGKAQIVAEYTPLNASIGALPGGSRIDAQTFTVNGGGVLSTIELALGRAGSAPAAVHVTLLCVDQGVPIGGSVL